MRAEALPSKHAKSGDEQAHGSEKERLGLGSHITFNTTDHRKSQPNDPNEAETTTPTCEAPLPGDDLRLWLRADAGITNNLGNRWRDQTPNHNDGVQSAAAAQPLLITSTINGHPVVRFDGVDDLLNLSTSPGTNDFSVFVVARTSLGHEVDAEDHSGSGGLSGQRFILAGRTASLDYNNGGAQISMGTNGISVYEYQRVQIGGDRSTVQAVSCLARL